MYVVSNERVSEAVRSRCCFDGIFFEDTVECGVYRCVIFCPMWCFLLRWDWSNRFRVVRESLIAFWTKYYWTGVFPFLLTFSETG